MSLPPKGKHRPRAQGTAFSDGHNPNDLWCTDYKGEFKLGNEKYCYPLTVTDYASRYLLMCEALESTREELAFVAFERLFKERGLPDIEYPYHDHEILVTTCGRIYLYGKKINFSTVFAGQKVGLKEVEKILG